MPSKHGSWTRLTAVAALGVVGLAAPVRASAQGGSVAGKVTDERGAALASAQITLDQSGKGAVSAADGNYLIEAVPARLRCGRARRAGLLPAR